jgi:hypothetical protein
VNTRCSFTTKTTTTTSSLSSAKQKVKRKGEWTVSFQVVTKWASGACVFSCTDMEYQLNLALDALGYVRVLPSPS